MAFADRADDAGFCWPSLPWICEWTCLSRTAVIQATKALESCGVIRVDRVKGRNNRVTLLLDAIRSQYAARTGAGETLPRTADAPPPVRETHGSGAVGAPETPAHPEDIKKQEKEQRSAPKHRIPEDWRPDAKLHAWACEKRPDLDLVTVIENFRDHYLATVELRTSWDVSFRSWVIRERGSAAHAGAAAPGSPRPYIDANETARMLATRDRHAVPPPVEIRQRIDQLLSTRHRQPINRDVSKEG